jgi:hypothetical protein
MQRKTAALNRVKCQNKNMDRLLEEEQSAIIRKARLFTKN